MELGQNRTQRPGNRLMTQQKNPVTETFTTEGADLNIDQFEGKTRVRNGICPLLGPIVFGDAKSTDARALDSRPSRYRKNYFPNLDPKMEYIKEG